VILAPLERFERTGSRAFRENREAAVLASWLTAEDEFVDGDDGSRAGRLGGEPGIGHQLGAAANVPHGHCSCVMLPSVLRWNRSVNAPQQAVVAQAMGANDETQRLQWQSSWKHWDSRLVCAMSVYDENTTTR
jgi:Iron-containing alcohol dehydrogenase